MTELSTQILLAMDDELSKTAVNADLLRRAGQFLKGQAGAAGAGIGAGGALGALAGGGLGGLRGYREARDLGFSRGESAAYAAQRGLKGAAKSGVLGAAAGGAAGLAGGQKARELAQGLVQRGTAGAPSRFAQRQLHSLTGYADREGLKAMGGGAETARKRLVAAGKALADAAPEKAGKHLKEIKRARAGLDAATKAEEAGLTSIPGIVKGLTGNAALQGKRLSPLEAAKTMVGEQWHGSGVGGKALMFGMPALGAASALRPGGPEEDQAGQGRLERAGRALGTGLAYATPLGIVGQGLLAKGMGAGAGLVGAGADTLRKRRKQRFQSMGELPPAKTGSEPDEEHSPNPERYMTPAAMGRPPEDMGV